MPEITLETLMTRKVVSVKPDASLDEVATILSQGLISCLLVCEGDVLVGIITERDITRILPRLLGDGEAPTTAAALMSSPVIGLPASTPLLDAVALARERRVRHFPVLDEQGQLVGVVTQTDLVNAYTRHMEQLVCERTTELTEANRQLQLLSLRDGLLGIGNRRSMEESLARAHDLATRYDRPYAVALFDVDLFKQYNDLYGHLAGDDALQQVARCIAEKARAADHLYRYGGEELLLIMPETRAQNAVRAAERIAGEVRRLSIAHPQSVTGVVTVSCGVGSVEGRGSPYTDWQALVRESDHALYRAKREGRNRVVWIGSSS